MAFWSFILSTYFLFLSVIPCYCDQDFVNTHDDQPQKITLNADHSTNHIACTPFCSCSAYHLHPNFIAKTDYGVSFTLVLTPQNSFYYDNLISSNPQDLFRPPRLLM